MRTGTRRTTVLLASAVLTGATVAQATTIESWNRDNVVTDLPNWPPGVEPTHTPGVTYDSTLFTGTDRVASDGAVIWKEGAVIAPGAQVLTESPGVGDNCIITSGTNRAVPGQIPKTCTDQFQSAKRVKLEARAAGTGTVATDGIELTDGKPLDMVFTVNDADTTERAYRVFKKYINATGERTAGFVVELGFGTGDDFVASQTGDGLRFSPRQQGQNPNIPAFEPLPFFSMPPGDSELGSLMSAGLFGDAADNRNRTIDGYFGLPAGVPAWTDPACDTDPSGTGRSYYDLVVRTEDRIETVGDVQGLHSCLFGNMLPQGSLPLGYFWDADGDPVTDADTIADWDGSGRSPACGGDGTTLDPDKACWQTYVVLDTDPTSATYGWPVLDDTGNFTRPANPPVAVPPEVVQYWVANPDTGDGVTPFFFITELDDMGLVNNNYWITVEAIDAWPTYNPVSGTATFTMRTSNVGEGGGPFSAPWLATLPDELDPEPAASDVAVTAFTANGDSPATVAEGDEVEIAVTVATADGQPTASGQVVGEATAPDGKVIASFFGVFSDLDAGSPQTLSFNWLVEDPTGLPESATWTVTVFPDGGDPNSGDNTATLDVTIGAAPTVDVALTVLDVPGNAKSGGTYAGSITVANVSNTAASGSVEVTANGEAVASFTFTGLQAGAEEIFDFAWTAPMVDRKLSVNWTATVSAVGDDNPDNDGVAFTTKVTPGGRNP